MPKYTIPDNFELGHVEGLLRRITECELKSDMSEAILQELVAITNTTSPAGWPFRCTRCKVEGYSLDFHKLHAGNCPACEKLGVVQVFPLARADMDELQLLKQIPQTLLVLRAWMDAQPEKPAEVYDMLTALIGRLKDYGVRF